MINYITKQEMIEKFGRNYFGLTQFFVDETLEPVIYIRNDIGEKCLPNRLRNWVEESVFAHEQEHIKNGRRSLELKSWVAGFKGNWKGFILGLLLSLTPSRIKMYPALTATIAVIIGVGLLVYTRR